VKIRIVEVSGGSVWPIL